MSKRGRKPKIYPKEIIDNIIYDFIKKNKNIGTLKYMDVFRHSKKMYEDKLCEYSFSEDFWRKSGRQGREAIDQTNKDKLTGALVMNENKLKKLIKSNNNLNSKLKKQNELNIELKKDIKKLKTKSEEYEDLFFQWLDASSNENVPLVNLITTGKTRGNIVNKLFETMFTENALEGYKEFENFRKKKSSPNADKDKIIKFKSKNTLVDDLDL